MKPQLLKIRTEPTNSFSIRQDNTPYMNNRWHYHPEVELIYFKNGRGMQFIGDSIKSFREGDIVMIGSNLSHYWQFDDVYLDENSEVAADIRVIHFCENFWGNHFLNLPETKSIKITLEKARRGIQISGAQKEEVGKLIDDALSSEGSKRIVLLMEILTVISKCKQTELSSVGFSQNHTELEDDRINLIYEYSLTNFKRQIDLKEIAQIANTSPNYFCRYFKSKTSKTYSQFLAEIRVGYACKLLIEDKINIQQICFESGFNNFGSFFKYFKSITGKSPLVYQKEFLQDQNDH